MASGNATPDGWLFYRPIHNVLNLFASEQRNHRNGGSAAADGNAAPATANVSLSLLEQNNLEDADYDEDDVEDDDDDFDDDVYPLDVEVFFMIFFLNYIYN